MSERPREAIRATNPSRPCPVCEGTTTGCGVGDSGLILCRKRDGPVAGFRHLGASGADPQFHLFRVEEPTPRIRLSAKSAENRTDWTALARTFAAQLMTDRRAELAAALQLPVAALDTLPLVGFDPRESCWTFPECDSSGTVIGLTRRFRDGSKKFRFGGHRGVTLPCHWRESPGPLFLVEGPSDVLTLAYAGLCVVGRPSNTGGVRFLVELLHDWPTDRGIVVVGENDRKPNGLWPGKDGAERTAPTLARELRRPIDWTLPPEGTKDARAWFTHASRGSTTWPDRGATFLAHATTHRTTVAPMPTLPPSLFAIGDRVSPTDRDNIGTITDLLTDGRFRVQFVGKDATTDKVFRAAELRPLTVKTGHPSTPPTRVQPLPAYVPFPLDTLPEPLRGFVAAVSTGVGCDAAFAALPALAAVAAAIGPTRVICPRPTWQEPAAVWAVTVGRSGAKKSPPFRAVEDAAEDINDDLDDDHRAAVEDYDRRLAEWQDGGEEGSKPKPPVKRRFAVQDTTIESLVGHLQDNPRGLFVARDELAGWLNSFARYTAAGSSDLPNWLQLFSRGTVNYTRKTGDRKEVRVRGVCVSVAGTIQPGVLATKMTAENRESGLLARLLLAMPPDEPRSWTEAEVDTDAIEAFGDLLRSLRRLGFDTGPRNRPRPHEVRLSPEAKALFIPFYNANGAAMFAADDDEAAGRAKLEAYALRFALVFHCIRYRDGNTDPPVCAEDMVAAVKLTQWFIGEMIRVYGLLAETTDHAAARKLHDWAMRLASRNGGRLTVRLVQNANSRKYPTAETAEAVLTTLATSGLWQWASEAVANRPGQTLHYLVRATSETPQLSEVSDCATDDEPTDSATDSTTDTGSDTNAAPTENLNENTHVSDVSDCRKGSQVEPAPEESRPGKRYRSDGRPFEAQG